MPWWQSVSASTRAAPTQIPDTQGGQGLKTQINALAAQTSGGGLDYLNQLAVNPNVKWDQVTLAHDNWRYEQAGLTPAGAALLPRAHLPTSS